MEQDSNVSPIIYQDIAKTRTDVMLWSFLQAFQQSPYKYLYMHQVLESLEQMPEFHVWHLMKNLKQRLPDSEIWIEKLLTATEQIFKRESLLMTPEINFVFYGQKNYPLPLRNISDPPLALSYQGDLNLISHFAISVVGCREPHELSIDWLQIELYNFLKQHRPTVVSGGARGIDQKAHFIAALMDIPTVVVLPSGLANKYPAVWNEKRWSEKPVIFISEMLLSERISKKNFSSRNRLIAAWGVATVIVEAHRRSGTLITAHHALAEGRPLWIVPGHPQMPSFAGSLELSFDHGQIVRNASDLSMLYEAESSQYLRPPLGLV